MIEAKIDQFNLILRAHDYDLLNREEWADLAEEFIEIFEQQTGINQLFGELSISDSYKPAAYSIALNYNRYPPHAIAFSDRNPDRGVMISTNAHFWTIWQQRHFEKFGERLELYKLFKLIQNPPHYTTHFSRIDLAVDYIDEGLDVGKIYRSLMDGRSDIYYDRETKKS